MGGRCIRGHLSVMRQAPRDLSAPDTERPGHDEPEARDPREERPSTNYRRPMGQHPHEVNKATTRTELWRPANKRSWTPSRSGSSAALRSSHGGCSPLTSHFFLLTLPFPPDQPVLRRVAHQVRVLASFIFSSTRAR